MEKGGIKSWKNRKCVKCVLEGKEMMEDRGSFGMALLFCCVVLMSDHLEVVPSPHSSCLVLA